MSDVASVSDKHKCHQPPMLVVAVATAAAAAIAFDSDCRLLCSTHSHTHTRICVRSTQIDSTRQIGTAIDNNKKLHRNRVRARAKCLTTIFLLLSFLFLFFFSFFVFNSDTNNGIEPATACRANTKGMFNASPSHCVLFSFSSGANRIAFE